MPTSTPSTFFAPMIRVTWHPRRNLMPSPSMIPCSLPPMSESSILGSTESSISTTVISSPRFLSAVAASMPMKPAPITTACFLSLMYLWIRLTSSSDVRVKTPRFSIPSIGGTRGRDPGAMSSLSYFSFRPSMTTRLSVGSTFVTSFPSLRSTSISSKYPRGNRTILDGSISPARTAGREQSEYGGRFCLATIMTSDCLSCFLIASAALTPAAPQPIMTCLMLA